MAIMIIQENSSGQWWSAGQGRLAILILEYVSSCPLQTCTINGREANYGWLLALVFEFGTWVGRFRLLTRARAFEQDCFAQKQKVKWGLEQKVKNEGKRQEQEVWFTTGNLRHEPRARTTMSREAPGGATDNVFTASCSLYHYVERMS